jgi:hypothetical protein
MKPETPTPHAKIRERLERIAAHRHRLAPHWHHGLYVLCCYCKRQKIDGQWMYLLVPAGETRISHGICNICLKKQLSKVKGK